MTTPNLGWGNPVVGGTALRIPAINSPNFNLVNPTASPTPSWAILQNGLAYFFGLVLTGGTLMGPDYIINTSGIFIYSGTPATGNLIGSWAGSADVDAFGNDYPQGINVTQGVISGATIIVAGSSGEFLAYSGLPANGNLQVSISGANGSDIYGNTFEAGIEVFGPTGSIIKLIDAGIEAAIILRPAGITHNTVEPQILSTVNNAGLVNEATEILITSGKENGLADAALVLINEPADASSNAVIFIEFGGNDEIFVRPGNGISACQPGSATTVETWHNMTLSSGWTLGAGGYAQYKKMPDNTVMIRGLDLVPGALANGTHLWTMVTGYIPTTAFQPITAITRAAAAIGTIPRLEATSTGTINIQDFPATTGSLYFSGSYALD